MIKFRLYLDKDEETKWLNELSANGYAMIRYFAGFYWFEDCEPAKYVYQVDFGTVSSEYREFMEEMGIEIVQCWGYWVVLRKLASEGEFQLYTDVDSSIEHYKKIRKMFKVVTIIELICFFMQIVGIIMGSAAALAGACVIGVLILGLMNATFKTNKIIAQLQERKGEQPEKFGGRQVSPFFVTGLLFSSIALTMSEASYPAIKTVLQIIAIIFMVLGLYKIGRERK